jgi:hypothetical protein
MTMTMTAADDASVLHASHHPHPPELANAMQIEPVDNKVIGLMVAG